MKQGEQVVFILEYGPGEGVGVRIHPRKATIMIVHREDDSLTLDVELTAADVEQNFIAFQDYMREADLTQPLKGGSWIKLSDWKRYCAKHQIKSDIV